MLERQCFHFWLPDIFNFKGGIQVYLLDLLKALPTPTQLNYEFLLKNDYSIPDNVFFEKKRFHCAGTWPLSLRSPAYAALIMGFGLWQKPNLIIAAHVNFTIVAYWLKQLTGIPYWTIAYGIEAWDITNPALQKALHHADKIFSISGYTRDRLVQEQNLDPHKISLLPCTFDPTPFQIAPKPAYLLDRYGIKPEQPTILTVARLANSEQYKGYDQILRSLPQIRQEIPNIHYVLVGKGDDRPRIEQLIAQLQLQDCVTLTGFIPDCELSDHYNLCDVFAMPSKGEGFGIVYLEALACGKPTLGGDRDGAIDALCHGDLGALVDPDDVGAIAQTIVQILQGTYSNSLLYQPENLRQKVIDIYGFNQFQKTVFQYIEEFLKETHATQKDPKYLEKIN